MSNRSRKKFLARITAEAGIPPDAIERIQKLPRRKMEAALALEKEQHAKREKVRAQQQVAARKPPTQRQIKVPPHWIGYEGAASLAAILAH